MKKQRRLPMNLIWVCVFGLILYGSSRLYYRMTDDFRVGNMTHEFAYREDWETPEPIGTERAELEQILDQNFSYLGKGAQSYAFVSSDDRYVLKFFKFKHLRPSPVVGILPSLPPFNQYKQLDQIRKHRKFNSVFSGYKLAHDIHKEGAGILYAHLNQTEGMWRKIKVTDKLGLPRTVDLDNVVFVVQDRVTKTRDVVRGFLEKGDVSGVKGCIRQVFDLYQEEYAKGVFDRDHGVMHNTGFIDDKVIHLDVGKFTRDDNIKLPKYNKSDLQKIACKFSVWIKNNFPSYHKEVLEDMETKMLEIYGEKVSISTSVE